MNVSWLTSRPNDRRNFLTRNRIDPGSSPGWLSLENALAEPPDRMALDKRIRHDKQAYKDRNVIERCYCRLKDFRRIATRYDKLARNYFSALCLVAAVAFWL